jgi:Zn-dependent oligopeptidase
MPERRGDAMIEFRSLTPEAIAEACEGAIRACDAALAAIAATPAGQRTFTNTFEALESAVDVIAQVEGSCRTSPTTTRCAKPRANGSSG